MAAGGRLVAVAAARERAQCWPRAAACIAARLPAAAASRCDGLLRAAGCAPPTPEAGPHKGIFLACSPQDVDVAVGARVTGEDVVVWDKHDALIVPHLGRGGGRAQAGAGRRGEAGRKRKCERETRGVRVKGGGDRRQRGHAQST